MNIEEIIASSDARRREFLRKLIFSIPEDRRTPELVARIAKLSDAYANNKEYTEEMQHFRPEPIEKSRERLLALISDGPNLSEIPPELHPSFSRSLTFDIDVMPGFRMFVSWDFDDQKNMVFHASISCPVMMGSNNLTTEKMHIILYRVLSDAMKNFDLPPWKEIKQYLSPNKVLHVYWDPGINQ